MVSTRLTATLIHVLREAAAERIAISCARSSSLSSVSSISVSLSENCKRFVLRCGKEWAPARARSRGC